MENIISKIMSDGKYISVIIIVIGIFVYMMMKKIIKKLITKNETNFKLNKKQKTYLKLFNNVIKYVILVIVIILVLQANGINVTSIVASLGLISVIVGFALQDALKDIIMGINIVVDDFFSVGDVVKIGDVEGKILEIGLKSTKMVDVNTNNILVISNRNISQTLNLSEWLDIDIPIPYEENITEIEKIINIMVKQIEKLENVKKVEYKGLNEFSNSAIYYKIRIWVKPEYKPQTKRDSNRIIKLELDKNNIVIPYQQIVIHNDK